MASLNSNNGEIEEESFVILGSSPLSSLNSKMESLLVTDDTLMKISQSTVESKSEKTSIETVQNGGGTNNANEPATVSHNAQMTNSAKSTVDSSITNSRTTEPSSMAASFILGDIGADTLKSSMYSQFPSICSMPNGSQELNKLQGFFTMYEDLKVALTKANESMKLFYDKWKNEHEARVSKEIYYEKQLQQLQTQIATIRNENIDLRRDLESKIVQLQINNELRQQEHSTLIQQSSEKTAQIKNMSSQIEKLEQQQLSSFEYMPKNENDSKEKPDYVDRGEHERIVKKLERQMSDLLAQNLDLKDVQKQYIDELNCLKVNCTAAEELIYQLRTDISLLKSEDMQKSEIFSKCETERSQMRDEISILRQQIEVYSKDFAIERTARENLAGEKDQLLQDLRLIQRKNQELIEQAQQRLEQASGGIKADIRRESYVGEQQPIRQPLPSSSTGQPTINKFCCPICYKDFAAITVLEQHVNSCLEDV